MNIRLLGPHDAGAYRNLWLEAMLNSPDAFESSYEEVKRHSIYVYKVRFQTKHVFTFGMFEADELTGVVTLIRDTKIKNEHRAIICALYVTPSVRGRGLGKELMQTAIAHATSLEGVEQIRLSVIVKNPTVKSLYYALGFVPAGTHKEAIKLGERYYDEEHMVMLLR